MGTGKGGRITKDDALKASKPSMGTPTGGVRKEVRTKMSMLRRKVAERFDEDKIVPMYEALYYSARQ